MTRNVEEGLAVSYGRMAVGAFAATVVYFIWGFLIEGLLIRKDFAPYAAIYRPAESVLGYFPLGILCTLIAAFIISLLYMKGYAGGSVADSARFGALIGLFVVCTSVGPNYVTLKIGGKLAAEIALNALVQWTLVGTIIGLICKPALAAAP